MKRKERQRYEVWEAPVTIGRPAKLGTSAEFAPTNDCSTKVAHIHTTPRSRGLHKKWDSFFIIISGVGLSPLGTAATSGLLYKQAPDDR
jgi:hypothetical protein